LGSAENGNVERIAAFQSVRRRGYTMSLLQFCIHPGCTTRTIGDHCVEHEPVREPGVFPRGRPFPAVARSDHERPGVPTLRPQGVTAAASGIAT
jgi:hypothetical protein